MKVRALIIVAAVLLSQGCSRDRGVQASEGQKPRPVKVEPAQNRDVRRQVDVVGTLAAREEVVVSAEVEGRVSRLAHDLGDRVSAGEAPIELDPQKLQYPPETPRGGLRQGRRGNGAAGGAPKP